MWSEIMVVVLGTTLVEAVREVRYWRTSKREIEQRDWYREALARGWDDVVAGRLKQVKVCEVEIHGMDPTPRAPPPPVVAPGLVPMNGRAPEAGKTTHKRVGEGSD